MNTKTPPKDNQPPFLGNWRNVYALLIGQLAVTVAVFYAVTWWAS